MEKRLRGVINAFLNSGQAEAVAVAEVMASVFDGAPQGEHAALVVAIADEFISAAETFKRVAENRVEDMDFQEKIEGMFAGGLENDEIIGLLDWDTAAADMVSLIRKLTQKEGSPK